jgi:hypothetical protein
MRGELVVREGEVPDGMWRPCPHTRQPTLAFSRSLCAFHCCDSRSRRPPFHLEPFHLEPFPARSLCAPPHYTAAAPPSPGPPTHPRCQRFCSRPRNRPSSLLRARARWMPTGPGSRRYLLKEGSLDVISEPADGSTLVAG